MKKNKTEFAIADKPIYNNQDFLWYFEERMSDMIRQEVSAHFANLFYKQK